MGKRSNGTRSQSSVSLAQSRTMSMASIGGGNKEQSFSGTKSYGFKLGGRDVEANFKNGAIEKIDQYFYLSTKDKSRLHNAVSHVLWNTLNKTKGNEVDSYGVGDFDRTGLRIISYRNYYTKNTLMLDQYGNVEYGKGKVDPLSFRGEDIDPKVFSKVLDKALRALKNPVNGDIKYRKKWDF
jgi:hypothetical protein